MAKVPLTSELIDLLADALDVPMTLEDACKFVGVSPRVVKRWLSEAEDEECADELKLELANRVARTMASGKRGELMSLLFVMAAADPKTAQFLTERLMPSMNLTKKTEVKAEIEAKVATIDVSALPEEELLLLEKAELIKKRLGG